MRASAAAALAYAPCSHQHNVVDHSFLLAVPRVARRHVKDRVSNWRTSSSSSSVTKRVTASRLEAIAGPWYFFSKLAARPSLKTPARRLLDVTVARRACMRLQKHWKRKRECPGEINVEGFGQDRQVPRRRGIIRSLAVSSPEPDPSRQRQGPRPPNRDVSECETCVILALRS